MFEKPSPYRNIYQTLKDNNNKAYVELNGPFPDNSETAWLWKGCYFWEGSLEIAKWWGLFSGHTDPNRFIICCSSYDYKGNDFFDIMGDTDHIKDFFEVAQIVASKKKVDVQEILVCEVFSHLHRKVSEFDNTFKAIRAYTPNVKRGDKVRVFYSKRNSYSSLEKDPTVQLCVFNSTKKQFLKSDFKIIYPESIMSSQQLEDIECV